MSQRQSRALDRDGAVLFELREDRERKDPDRNVLRGTTREEAADAGCLLRGLWQRTLPGKMRPLVGHGADSDEVAADPWRSAGFPRPLAFGRME